MPWPPTEPSQSRRNRGRWWIVAGAVGTVLLLGVVGLVAGGMWFARSTVSHPYNSSAPSSSFSPGTSSTTPGTDPATSSPADAAVPDATPGSTSSAPSKRSGPVTGTPVKAVPPEKANTADGTSLPVSFDGYTASTDTAESARAARWVSPAPAGSTATLYRRGPAVAVVALAPSAPLQAGQIQGSPFTALTRGDIICESMEGGGGVCQRGGAMRNLLVVSTVSVSEARAVMSAMTGS